MGKTAYQKASEVLSCLRDCIHKATRIPSDNTKEQGACNIKIQELYNELDDVCRAASIPFLRYTYLFHGMEKELMEVGDATEMEVYCWDHLVQEKSDEAASFHLSKPHDVTDREVLDAVENDLISQAGDWLKANKESLSGVILKAEEAPVSQSVESTERAAETKRVVKANKATGDLTFGDNTFTLSTLDIKLLDRLNKDVGKSVSKDNIISWVWGHNPPHEDQLYIRVGNLRKAFEQLKIPAEIETIHRVGDKLLVDGVTFEIR